MSYRGGSCLGGETERRCLNRLRWGDFPNRALAGVGMALYQELPHPRCMVVSCSAGFIVKVLGPAGFCLPQSTQAGRHWEGSPGLCCTVGLSLQLQPEPDFCLICNGRAPSGATSNPLCLFLFFFFSFFTLCLIFFLFCVFPPEKAFFFLPNPRLLHRGGQGPPLPLLCKKKKHSVSPTHHPAFP